MKGEARPASEALTESVGEGDKRGETTRSADENEPPEARAAHGEIEFRPMLERVFRLQSQHGTVPLNGIPDRLLPEQANAALSARSVWLGRGAHAARLGQRSLLTAQKAGLHPAKRVSLNALHIYPNPNRTIHNELVLIAGCGLSLPEPKRGRRPLAALRNEAPPDLPEPAAENAGSTWPALVARDEFPRRAMSDCGILERHHGLHLAPVEAGSWGRGWC